MTNQYRKKPVVIKAVQWNGYNVIEIAVMGSVELKDKVLKIQTLEGDMTAQIGDYIIKGIQGELYPCKPDIFKQTYELVE